MTLSMKVTSREFARPFVSNDTEVRATSKNSAPGYTALDPNVQPSLPKER
jgi:hypothetical protein